MAPAQDTLVHRDQSAKEQAEALVQKANGTRQDLQADGLTSTAGLTSKAKGAFGKGTSQNQSTAGSGQPNARALAVTYIALAAAVVALIGSVGPMVAPDLYEQDPTGLARSLEDWSPLPQAGLAALVLALLVAVVILRGKRSTGSQSGRQHGCGCRAEKCMTACPTMFFLDCKFPACLAGDAPVHKQHTPSIRITCTTAFGKQHNPHLQSLMMQAGALQSQPKATLGQPSHTPTHPSTTRSTPQRAHIHTPLALHPLCPAALPAGVSVSPDGMLCDESGVPLPRGLKLEGSTITIAASGTKLPKSKHPTCVRELSWPSSMVCLRRF
jgi:hypothetical protein